MTKFEPKFDPITKAPLCGYIAIYGSKQTEIWAPSLYAAKQAAIRYFKPKKAGVSLITVTLCVRADGSEVVHIAD